MICRGNNNDTDACESGAVRLRNETKSHKFIRGIVEMCDSGQWVGICSGYWRDIHTRLTCQKLLGKSLIGMRFLQCVQ